MKDSIEREWYYVKNIEEIDSPALVVYPERVRENVKTAISMINDLKRLRPHVKTHKTKEATLMMMSAGINKFKCATISEAEMLAIIDASDVLFAYQPAGPKLQRFILLVKEYPNTKFSCLIDNINSAKTIADAAFQNDIEIPVYIDLNVGMNRTGITPENAVKLYKDCAVLKGIRPVGLHAYDGHIRTKNFEQRKKECDDAFKPVEDIQAKLVKEGFEESIIAGGSLTFSIHAKRKNIECSPGTFIYWDYGYQTAFTEQTFLTAALVITRIVSLPDKSKLCLDLGHKSISAENELSKRVYFLNAPDVKFISQSEEHLVVETNSDHSYKIGDVFYGLPFHICPTCALYESAITIKNNETSGEWKIIARDRKINV